ncbi:MAG TPA: response regulator transcription factor [Mycobacteriales bacterium]|jgi:two-component system nitrate/nitrite response regulator NarL|nr:response regulator transcription factor [Mycobacteriales bacterium]
MTRPKAQVTVVVADDHPVYREGIVRVLKESATIRVVAEASDGRAALAAIREHCPDVALVDYKMPGLNGLDVVHAVERDGLSTRVIVLSAFDDAALVYQALAAGASGYLTKEADREEIAAAVAQCARGERYVPAQLAGKLAGEVHQRSRGEAALLSPRELEAVRMIAEGLSVPQMAERLHLAPTTVRTHVQNLYEKLGVSDRGAAVAAAMRRRLLE